MTESQASQTDHVKTERRGFLAGAVAAMASFIGGAIAVPSLGHIISPALKPSERPLLPVGDVDEFEIGTPKKIEFVYYQRDGWIEERASGSAWVVRSGSAEFTVFDPRCTHLGCPYGWSPELGQFACPCHDAYFSIDGKVIAGPPPRPLDFYENKVENGKLFIREVAKRA